MTINKTIRNKESDAFPKVEHGPDNPVASLDYAHVHKSITHLYVTMRLAKRTHQQVILKKHPKHNKWKVSRMRE